MILQEIEDELVKVSVRGEHVFDAPEIAICEEAGGGEDGIFAVARHRSTALAGEVAMGREVSDQTITELADKLMLRIVLAAMVELGEIVEVEDQGPSFSYYPSAQ